MIYVFAMLVIALIGAGLIDEFRYGGSLSLLHSEPHRDVLDLPIPDGWEEHDVLRTLAEIASL